MSDFLAALDAYVKAARTLCERPSIQTAVAFWTAKQSVKEAQFGISWDAVRSLLLERYGPGIITLLSRAAALRAQLLAMPGHKSTRRKNTSSASAPRQRRNAGLPVHSH